MKTAWLIALGELQLLMSLFDICKRLETPNVVKTAHGHLIGWIKKFFYLLNEINVKSVVCFLHFEELD